MYQEFKIYITFFLCVDMHICTCVYGGTQRHSVQWHSKDNLSSLSCHSVGPGDQTPAARRGGMYGFTH